MLRADPAGFFHGQLAPRRWPGQPRDVEDGVIAGQPDPSAVADLDGMPSGERSKRREREDAPIEVEAAIGEAIPGRGPELDAGVDVARDDKTDRSRRRFIVIGGRGSGDVNKPQRRLIERRHAAIEAEVAGDPPGGDIVIAEDEDHRRRGQPVAEGPKLCHDLARAAARGMEEIAEDEHPGHVMIAHEGLKAGEISLRRAFGDRDPGPAKRGRLPEMEISDKECPRGREQRPAAREEKNVGRGRRGCRMSRSPRKAAGGRAPGSGDDGKRRRHAVWFQGSIDVEGMRFTVAVADQPGQRPGTGPGRH